MPEQDTSRDTREMDLTSIAPFYKGWDNYQRMLVEAVAPLSDTQLALLAAPNLRPAWALAAHIIAARASWLHRRLGEGPAELLAYLPWDDDGEPQRGAAELVSGLDATWAVIADCLNRWTPAYLEGVIQHPVHGPLTRQWILWHLIEHDLHHGGELFFTLGMHGLPTPEL